MAARSEQRQIRLTLAEKTALKRRAGEARRQEAEALTRANGNPNMDNVAAIFDAIRQRLKVDVRTRSVVAA
jgi:hypothetical protein